jgi:hypothetical protein
VALPRTWANGDVDEVASAGENVRRAALTILDALVVRDDVESLEVDAEAPMTPSAAA